MENFAKKLCEVLERTGRTELTKEQAERLEIITVVIVEGREYHFASTLNNPFDMVSALYSASVKLSRTIAESN